jgi:hypothetical protein
MAKKAKPAKKSEDKTQPFTWGGFDKMLTRAVIPPVRKPAPKSA